LEFHWELLARYVIAIGMIFGGELAAVVVEFLSLGLSKEY
jgi:hypothetical protein